MMDYDEFRKLYMKQHRNSIPNRGTQAWVRILAIALFLSSAAVSGAHTIPTIAETLPFDESLGFMQIAKIIIAVISLFMVEIALFGTAFAQRMELIARKHLLTVMKILALVVAIAGNLYSTFKALDIDLSDPNWFTLLVGVAIGLGAPLFTMFSGDLLAGVELKHQEAWKAFDVKVLSAFKQQDKAEKKASKRVQLDSPMDESKGYVKDASERVREYLETHPEEIEAIRRKELTGGQLAKKLGIGRSTAYSVLSEFSTNGQHDE